MNDDIDIVNNYLSITDQVETRLALMNLLKVLRAWKKRDMRQVTKKYRGE